MSDNTQRDLVALRELLEDRLEQVRLGQLSQKSVEQIIQEETREERRSE